MLFKAAARSAECVFCARGADGADHPFVTNDRSVYAVGKGAAEWEGGARDLVFLSRGTGTWRWTSEPTSCLLPTL